MEPGQPTPKPLLIWQQNVNKSPTCQHTLLSNNTLVKHDVSIVTLQEPAINSFNNSIASKDWITVYPSSHRAHPEKTRTLTLIRSALITDTWEQIDFPSGDVTIITLKGEWGKINIFNIYNDGNSNDTIKQLKRFHSSRPDVIELSATGTAHTIWVGDFNRHHPQWDNHNDERLFTTEAIDAATVLIEALASLGMEMVLPGGIPTHCHNVTKKWTRLDQVFISDHSTDLVELRDTETRFRSLKTDHLPVITKLNLATVLAPPSATHNFRQVDWVEFRNKLATRLNNLGEPQPISNQEQLNVSCEALTLTIQETIKECVPITEICSKFKHWWTKELTNM